MTSWNTAGVQHDLRNAVRVLRKKPGHTFVVLLTIALGIGATTAIFSLVYGILLRPFPYAEPDRLVRLRTTQANTVENVREASIYDFRDWRSESRSFEDMAAYWSFVNSLSGEGAAQSVLMTFATPQLFSVLGVNPILGRVFTPAEDQIGGSVNQVVLSFALWQSRFGGDRKALGRAVKLRGDSYTIIGVMPPGFRFPERSDVWVPLMARYASFPTPWWKDRDVRIHSVLARLKPGVTTERAQADMDAIARRLAGQYPTTNKELGIRVATMRDAEVGNIRPYLVLLLAAVGLVLLISCVNVAGFLLARAVSREREMAIRTALGSTRGRLVRQLLVESVLMSLLGGLLGVALAIIGVRALLALIPVELPFWMKFEVNAVVLVFSAAVSLLTGIAFGLAPALHSSRSDLVDSLKDGAKGSANPSRQRLRRMLVVAEIALSMLLVVGAGLMMRSFLNLHGADAGFRPQGLLSAYVGQFLPNRSYREMIQAHSADFRRILDGLARTPGVISAAGSDILPYYDQPEARSQGEVAVRGQTDAEQRRNIPIVNADVTPDYFHTMGIPIVQGRDFTEADDWEAPFVALVSAHTAQMLWPGRDPIGQEIRLGKASAENPWHRVIGLVGNTKWNATERQPGGEIYTSYRQWPTPKLHLLVRTSVDPASLAPVLRRIVQAVNPENAITYIEPMDGIIGDSLWQRRLWAFLFAVFAAAALCLAAVGIYGVMSHAVGQRRREIGIRVALGARPSDVLKLVLGQGMSLTLIGMVGGLGGSLVLTRSMASLLFGVTVTDPLTFGLVTLLLGGVALAACYIPARRATRVDPMVALRHE